MGGGRGGASGDEMLLCCCDNSSGRSCYNSFSFSEKIVYGSSIVQVLEISWKFRMFVTTSFFASVLFGVR